jgi:hypothetical protein
MPYQMLKIAQLQPNDKECAEYTDHDMNLLTVA